MLAPSPDCCPAFAPAPIFGCALFDLWNAGPKHNRTGNVTSLSRARDIWNRLCWRRRDGFPPGTACWTGRGRRKPLMQRSTMPIAIRTARENLCLSARSTGRAALWRGGSALAALLLSACSVLLNSDGVQCNSDADCVRFPNAVCNRTTNLCIGRPIFSMPLPMGVSDAAPQGQDGDSRATGPVADGAAADVHSVECPDLNGNAVLDCKESLVANPSFRSDLAGWTAEVDTQQTLIARDGQDNPTSASMVVINARHSDSDLGSTMGGSVQCVRATDAGSYDFAVQALAMPSPATMVWGGVAFVFFTSPDCSGASNGAYSPTLSSADTAGWQVLRGIVSPPFGTKSMMLRLVVVKPFKQQPSAAIFDNVLLKLR